MNSNVLILNTCKMGIKKNLKRVLGIKTNVKISDEQMLEKIKIVKSGTLKNIRKFSDDYPHVLLASRESSTEETKTEQVLIKEYHNISEFISELTIMEKISKLSIKIPTPRLYGACDYKNSLINNNMPSFRLVMEKIEAPDLLTCIINNNLNYTDRLKICRQLVSLIKRLHNNNIIHRDIKCENLLVSMGKTPKLTIIDFALSLIVRDDNIYYHERVGTKNYFSPELYYKHKYLPKFNDIWSIGVVIYILLSGGYYPFLYSSDMKIRKFYKKVIYKIHYDNIDNRIVDVLKCIFVPETQRLSIFDLSFILIPIVNDIISENTSGYLMSPRRSVLIQTL